MTVNRHGLSRNVDAATSLQIRKNCGFGCVICGFAFCDYEHIEPTFAEAKVHDPTKMCLLCKQCHGKVTHGWMAKETVVAAAANPKCLQTGYSHGDLNFTGHPTVAIGGIEFRNVENLLSICGEDVLKVAAPVEPGGPFLLSALIRNAKGDEILRIEDNVWKCGIANWDVEKVGPTLTIRTARGRIAFKMRADPPQRLIIERIDMEHRGFRLHIDGDTTLIKLNGRTIGRTPEGTVFENCSKGIEADDTGVKMGFGGTTILAGGSTWGGGQDLGDHHVSQFQAYSYNQITQAIRGTRFGIVHREDDPTKHRGSDIAKSPKKKRKGR